MNQLALTAFGRMFEKVRRDRRLTRYQVAQMLEVPSHIVSCVESGEIASEDPILEKIAECFGIPLKMVDACRRPPPAEPARCPTSSDKRRVTNVISFESYREKKWRQMSLFEKD